MGTALDNGIIHPVSTPFLLLDDGSRPDFARLEKQGPRAYKPGEVTLLIPGVDEIHQIDNSSSRPTVEVHVYGRDLAGLQRCRYDLETGKVSPFVLAGYNNA